MLIFPRFRPRMFSFDREIIRRNWNKINESPLKKAGLYARRVMINSIRVDRSRAQRPSRPGRPPKSHDSRQRFRMIYSVPGRGNVVIGHAKLFNLPDNQTAMSRNEFGEWVRIRRLVIPRNRRRISSNLRREAIRQMFLSGRLRSAPLQQVNSLVKMPERPFALPALQKTERRLPTLWANSVTSATVRN